MLDIIFMIALGFMKPSENSREEPLKEPPIFVTEKLFQFSVSVGENSKKL